MRKKQLLSQSDIPAALLAEIIRLKTQVKHHEENGWTGTVYHDLLALRLAELEQLEAAGAAPADDALEEALENGAQDK